MGLFQAVSGLIGGVLADQWKDFNTISDGFPSTAWLAPRSHPPHRSRTALLLMCALLAAPTLHADPGDLDPSFNGGMFGIKVASRVSGGYAMALHQDGRVLLGGTLSLDSNSGWWDWLLAQRNPDGTVDGTFGGGTGGVDMPVGGIDSKGHSYGVLHDLAIQSDGKIIGVGWANGTAGSGSNTFVARWNGDGTLDSGFGSGGIVENVQSSNSLAWGVVLQQDGKAVVVASLRHASPPDEPLVIRYTTSGLLDPTFATGGVFRMPASVPLSKRNFAWSITMQPDGKILVGTGDYANKHPEVLRLTGDGVLDGSFGTGGIAVLTMMTMPEFGIGGVAGLAVQPDGKIAGIAQGGWVFRLNKNGTIDTGFHRPDGFGTLSGVTPIAIASLPTGELLVSADRGSSQILQLDRFATSGFLDAHFTKSDGTSHRLNYSSLSGRCCAAFYALAIQPDGRFLASGYDHDTVLSARFLGNPLQLRPHGFTFASVANAPVSTVQVSKTVTITSLTAGAYVPVRVFGGRYSVNGDPFTRLLGYVKNGDQVMVEHTSAATAATVVTTTLHVGGINSSKTPWIVDGPRVVATFTSTTR